MADISGDNSHQAEENDETNSRHLSEPAHGTNDGPPVCIASHEQKKIILHVDLNNTILVSDAATCQGTVAALDYFLTTVTWGKMSKGRTIFFNPLKEKPKTTVSIVLTSVMRRAFVEFNSTALI